MGLGNASPRPEVLSGGCRGQALLERKWDRGMREPKALTGKRHDAPEALGAVVGDGGGGRARSRV